MFLGLLPGCGFISYSTGLLDRTIIYLVQLTPFLSSDRSTGWFRDERTDTPAGASGLNLKGMLYILSMLHMQLKKGRRYDSPTASSIRPGPVSPYCTCVARALSGRPIQNHRYLRNTDGKPGVEGEQIATVMAQEIRAAVWAYLDGKT
jgi:hypothetical protein